MFEQILFLSSAFLTVASAVLVAATRDVLHASIYLLGSLLGVAGLYLTLGADFVAATQLMVYVGGVVILMLFAVMLTGGKNLAKAARHHLENNPLMGGKKSYLWAGLVAFIIILIIVKLLVPILSYHHLTDIIPYTSTVAPIGEALVGKHVLAFEISSVLLLGALVGAAIIARPSKEGGE